MEAIAREELRPRSSVGDVPPSQPSVVMLRGTCVAGVCDGGPLGAETMVQLRARVSCPACQQKFLLRSRRQLNKKTVCPQCGTDFIVQFDPRAGEPRAILYLELPPRKARQEMIYIDEGTEVPTALPCVHNPSVAGWLAMGASQRGQGRRGHVFANPSAAVRTVVVVASCVVVLLLYLGLWWWTL